MAKFWALMAAMIVSAPAFAHHPLGGLPMETFFHGALSGIGHPLLGFDHLFFVLLVGIASAFTAQRLLAPLAYLATMLLGCLVSALWVALPAAEVMVALSLLVLGGMVLSGRAMTGAMLLLTFAAFGLFHGSAFGATLATQEAGFGMQVLLGYLLGLGIIQYLLALAGGALCVSVWHVSRFDALQPRLAGAMVAGAGLLLTLEHLEGPLLRLL